MKDSRKKSGGADWSMASAWQNLEDMSGQFKRNVDMRMKRGDVRASILRLLLESPMHGYQIIHEIESRSGGVWKPSAGSVYPTLQLLADEGLIRGKESAGRRTYSLTDTGLEVAEADAKSPAPWLTSSERPAGPRAALAVAGVKIARAAAEVARTGSKEQMASAAAILDDATSALSKLLTQN
jgi:DNA-binding PadR family transcriptional regulator